MAKAKSSSSKRSLKAKSTDLAVAGFADDTFYSKKAHTGYDLEKAKALGAQAAHNLQSDFDDLTRTAEAQQDQLTELRRQVANAERTLKATILTLRDQAEKLRAHVNHQMVI